MFSASVLSTRMASANRYPTRPESASTQSNGCCWRIAQPPAPSSRAACRIIQDLIAEYQGGEFSIFFANCEPLSAVSFELRTELYNVKPNGKRDYLSIGEDALPTVYMVRLQSMAKS